MTILGLSLAVAMSLGTDAAVGAQLQHKPEAALPASAAPAIQTGAEPFDIDAREKQVASGDQRIAPLAPQEFTKEAKEIMDSLQAFFGAKEDGVPKSFATMAKHPGLYRGQMQLGLELNCTASCRLASANW